MRKSEKLSNSELIDPLEQKVFQAIQGSRKLIHQALKIESKLSMRSEADEDNESNSVQIPIKVDPGLPESIIQLQRSPDFAHIIKLLEYKHFLEQVRHGLPGLGMLRLDLLRMPNPDSWIGATNEDLNSVMKWAEMLLQRIDEFEFVKKILNYNEDVLGLYQYEVLNEYDDDSQQNRAEIYIYWKVIGIVASALNITVEDLTVVVLAHELSHAYTQLGADTDGRRWHSRSFSQTETGLVEGLAQYYTQRVLKRMQVRFPKALDAYEALLNEQPEDYKTHLPWLATTTPEVIRRSLLEVRRANEISVKDFENRLNNARKDLSAKVT